MVRCRFIILPSQQVSFIKSYGADICVYTPATLDELREIQAYSIIGRTTKLLFAKKSSYTVVSLLQFANELLCQKGRVCVGAGVRLPELIHFAEQHGLGGLDFTYPIPATVGGAIYQNFGAFGQSMGDFVDEVTVLDLNGNIKSLSHDQLGFGYRTSCFQSSHEIILSATLQLISLPIDQILRSLQNAKKSRLAKIPLTIPTLGSVFKNPISIGKSAGQLIDELGLKTLRIGDAVVYTAHGNVIVNAGKATGVDILALIQKIQQIVYNEIGIKLEEEVIVI